MWTFALLLLVLLLALYDLRAQRIPNWVTLPLLAAGILANFPGRIEVWLGCILLSSAWRLRWLGGGDAKLWMALFWLTPSELAAQLLPAFAVCFAATGVLQLLWRKARSLPISINSPAAWRAVPFTVWVAFHVH